MFLKNIICCDRIHRICETKQNFRGCFQNLASFEFLRIQSRDCWKVVNLDHYSTEFRCKFILIFVEMFFTPLRRVFQIAHIFPSILTFHSRFQDTVWQLNFQMIVIRYSVIPDLFGSQNVCCCCSEHWYVVISCIETVLFCLKFNSIIYIPVYIYTQSNLFIADLV
jgi:hypothetical protein